MEPADSQANESLQKAKFYQLRKEYRHLLTKLAEVLFILEGNYITVLNEIDAPLEKLHFSYAASFIMKVADQLKYLDTIDNILIESIQNWDNLGTNEVIDTVEYWISLYIKEYLEESRMEDVIEFISTQEYLRIQRLAG